MKFLIKSSFDHKSRVVCLIKIQTCAFYKKLYFAFMNVYLQRGIKFFNQKKFYEAHEEIEEIWLHDQSENRLFYQALIIAAGACHHIQKKRFKPARKALQKAINKIAAYPDQHLGIDKKEIVLSLESILRLEDAEMDTLSHFPQIKTLN